MRFLENNIPFTGSTGAEAKRRACLRIFSFFSFSSRTKYANIWFSCCWLALMNFSNCALTLRLSSSIRRHRSLRAEFCCSALFSRDTAMSAQSNSSMDWSSSCSRCINPSRCYGREYEDPTPKGREKRQQHTRMTPILLRILMTILPSSPSIPETLAEASTPRAQSEFLAETGSCRKTRDTICAHSSSLPW